MRKICVLMIFSLMITFLSISKVNANDLNTELNNQIQRYCVEYGDKYGIAPELLMAIIERESMGDKKAENNGCKGLMQVNEKFHIDRMKRLKVKDLYEVKGNILVGTDYLLELFEEYHEIYLVLMVYNMGPTKALELWEQEKISQYAISVTERSAELERLHGK